ncbi:MAG: hypothetical protein LBV23_01760 [Deltaproteobacteria bacterium]|nr:hypothetical protein [Deltaproteobacteria bacterium]
MAFTDQDLASQKSKIEQLKDSLSELNSRFNQHLKALDLTEDQLRQYKTSDLNPEEKKLIDQAKAEAEKEGQLRSREASEGSGTHKSAPSRRSGAIAP